jgi:hypothetical protein
MQQTLLEPPSREPAGMELAVLRWTPDEHRDHGSYSCGCNQSWIVLQPEISSKPNYGTCSHPFRAFSLPLSLSLCCRNQHHVATTVLFSLQTRMECREALKTLGLAFVLQSWKYLTSLCNLRCSLSNGVFFVSFLPQTTDLDLTLLSVLFCFLKASNELFFQYLSAWIWQLVLQRASLAKFRPPSGSRPWPYSTTVSKERAKLPEGKKQEIPVEQNLN